MTQLFFVIKKQTWKRMTSTLNFVNKNLHQSSRGKRR